MDDEVIAELANSGFAKGTPLWPERWEIIECLELLVKIAAREQRDSCAHNFPALRIQNAPCPDVNRVLELWHKEVTQTNKQRHNEAMQPTACSGG